MRRLLLIALAAGAIPARASAQVADVVAAVGAGAPTAIFDVAISGTVDNVCLVALGKSTGASTITACSVGGTSCTHVPNADAGNGGITTTLYSVPLGTTTGSQTVSVTVSAGRIGVIALCASHVDQTSPVAHGVNHFTASSSGPDSLAIPSAATHLTADLAFAGDTSAVVSAPTQTFTAFADLGGGTACPAGQQCLGMSTAAGSASNTHTWTITAGSTVYHSGVDLVASGGSTPASRPCVRPFLGVGRCGV